jgi:hypothetical protein
MFRTPVLRCLLATVAALIAIGLAGYFIPEQRNFTALIPAAFGTVLFVCGALAAAFPGGHKHFMHAAAMVTLLGLLGTAMGVVKAVLWALGTEPARPAAVAAQTLTFVVLAWFLAAAIRSFIAARKARQAAAAAAGQA